MADTNQTTTEEITETPVEETVVETTPEVDSTAENVEETSSDEPVVTEEEAVAETTSAVSNHPDFRPGDTIRVHYRIIEGDKTRTQPFEGIVIGKKGSGISKTFTVRRIGADGVGVERIIPLASKNLEKLEVIKLGKVRRAKLYYLRDKVGKAAMKIKERKAK